VAAKTWALACGTLVSILRNGSHFHRGKPFLTMIHRAPFKIDPMVKGLELCPTQTVVSGGRGYHGVRRIRSGPEGL